MDSVPPSAIDYFRQSAEQLIEEKGAVEALAAALAHISGATSIEQRSLLNSDAVINTQSLIVTYGHPDFPYAISNLRNHFKFMHYIYIFKEAFTGAVDNHN